jgi:hypothetical protein
VCLCTRAAAPSPAPPRGTWPVLLLLHQKSTSTPLLVQFEGVPDAHWFVKFREMTSGVKKRSQKTNCGGFRFFVCAEWVRVGESG